MLAAAGGSQPLPGGGGNDQHHAHFHYSLRNRTNLKRKKTADGTSDIPPVQSKVAKRAWRTPPVLGWVNKKKRSFVKFGVKTVIVHKLYTGEKKGKGKGKAVDDRPDPDSDLPEKEYGAVSSHGYPTQSQSQRFSHGYPTRSQSQRFSESTTAVPVPDGRQERGPNLDGRDDSRVEAEQVDIAELQMDNLLDAESIAVHMLTILRKQPPRRD